MEISCSETCPVQISTMIMNIMIRGRLQPTTEKRRDPARDAKVMRKVQRSLDGNL